MSRVQECKSRYKHGHNARERERERGIIADIRHRHLALFGDELVVSSSGAAGKPWQTQDEGTARLRLAGIRVKQRPLECFRLELLLAPPPTPCLALPPSTYKTDIADAVQRPRTRMRKANGGSQRPAAPPRLMGLTGQHRLPLVPWPWDDGGRQFPPMRRNRHR